jgi:sugar phosphate permease
MRYEHSLDALNFFLADVRQGFGPYLAIYLLTERHWAQDQIGFVMTIATVCGLMVQTPAGALTDSSHAKRAIIVTAALVVTGASILLRRAGVKPLSAATKGPNHSWRSQPPKARLAQSN